MTSANVKESQDESVENDMINPDSHNHISCSKIQIVDLDARAQQLPNIYLYLNFEGPRCYEDKISFQVIAF